MKRNNAIYSMTVISLLSAIMFLMGFTPLGTIQTLFLTITLLGIPLAIAACVFGPWMGAVLGFVWGTVSLIQGISGYDPLGLILMEYSLPGLVITAYVPRILTGFLAGAVYQLNEKWDKKGHLNALISSASVSFFNTTLFMTSFTLFFFNAPEIQASAMYITTKYGVNGFNPFIFIVFSVGLNFFVELAVNAIVGSAAVYGVKKAAKALKVQPALPTKIAFWRKKPSGADGK